MLREEGNGRRIDGLVRVIDGLATWKRRSKRGRTIGETWRVENSIGILARSASTTSFEEVSLMYRSLSLLTGLEGIVRF